MVRGTHRRARIAVLAAIAVLVAVSAILSLFGAECGGRFGLDSPGDWRCNTGGVVGAVLTVPIAALLAVGLTLLALDLVRAVRRARGQP